MSNVKRREASKNQIETIFGADCDEFTRLGRFDDRFREEEMGCDDICVSYACFV